MTQLVTFTKQGNIGLLALDNPPVNALSHAVREKLHELLSLAVAAPGVEALVIYCEGRTFIAGADIHEFGKPPLAPDLPELVEYLASIDRPTVLVHPGLLARYGLLSLLAPLQERSRRGPGVVLLIPGSAQQTMPAVDDVALPVVHPSDWARVPRGWHRAPARVA